MTYDERMTLISKELANLLGMYDPPRNIKTDDQKRSHIEMIAKTINSKLPNDTTSDHISGTFERAAMEITSKQKTSTWPHQADLIKAITKSIDSGEAQTKSIEDDIEAAARFLEANGTAHPSYRSTFIAKQLIERGLLKDERDAHWRGFDMFEYKELYLKQRMTLAEWKNHIRVLANMCNMTKEEAEDRELFGYEEMLGPINPDILPEELLPRLRQAGM